jgi:hypothetical protein
MPTRTDKTGKTYTPQTASKSGAAKKTAMAAPPPPPAPADSDPPIIVQGGGSIHLNLPPKFINSGDDPVGKKFKNALGNLDNVVIDDTITIKLKPTSKIVINYTG